MKKSLIALTLGCFCSSCVFFVNAPSDQYRKLNSTQELARVYPKLERECSTDKTMVIVETFMAVTSIVVGGVMLIDNQSDPDGMPNNTLGDAIDDGMNQVVGVGALLASGIFGASAYLRSTKIDRCQEYLIHLRNVRQKEVER